MVCWSRGGSALGSGVGGPLVQGGCSLGLAQLHFVTGRQLSASAPGVPPLVQMPGSGAVCGGGGLVWGQTWLGVVSGPLGGMFQCFPNMGQKTGGFWGVCLVGGVPGPLQGGLASMPCSSPP